MPDRFPSDSAAAPPAHAPVYRFLGFELDLQAGELCRGDEKMFLSRQQLALLGTLVRSHGRTVGRETLLREVWGPVVVSEGALRQAVWELRKLLGAGGEPVIEAVRGRGYRLAARIDAAPAPAQAELPVRSSADRLLGRDREIEELERMRRDALQRAGRACVLIAPAGVGKSRLAREVIERAAIDGVACSESYAACDGALPPLWPWTQLLEASLLDAGDALRARCRALAPDVFAWLESDAASAGAFSLQEPSERRLRLFEQLSRALTAALRDVPRVCLLEDVQWADEASLAFLAHHARALTQCRALWIITYRSTDEAESAALARALHALDQGPHNRRLQLSNLGRDEVEAMLARHLGDDASEQAATQVHALTRGNPLFVLELSRALVEGAISREHAPQLDATALQPVIERRLRRLPVSALRALQAAAVLGRDFAAVELAAVLEQPASEVFSRIDECLQSGILEEVGEQRFGFAHPLLQQVAYALLAYGERSRLHGLAGGFLESLADNQSPRRLSELAHHFHQAGETGQLRKALDYARKAGEAALAATAYGSAAAHFARAVRCSELLACTPAERIALELSQVEALHAEQGSSEQTRAAYLALAEHARAASLWELHARAALGYTGHQHTRFVPARFAVEVDPRELSLLEQALAGLHPAPSEPRVLTLCSLAYALSGTGDVARCRRLMREALDQARTLGHDALLARALSFDVYIAAGPDDAAEKLATCDALVELTLKNGLQELELEARIARYLWLFCHGDRAAAMRDAERAAQLAELLGTARARSRAQLPALIDAFGSGRLDEAERLTEAAHAAAADDPNQQAISMMRTASLETLRGRADLDEAVCGYEFLLAANPHAVGIRAILSSTYATLGRHDEARREFDAVAADGFAALPRDINWLPTMALLADAVMYMGDADRARSLHDQLLPYADAFIFFGVETTPGGAVALWVADLAVVLGELERAQALFERAQALHTALGMTMLHQYCALGRARLLLATRTADGADAARRLLAQVRRFADEHAVAWLRSRADDVERRVAASPAGAVDLAVRSAQRDRSRDN